MKNREAKENWLSKIREASLDGLDENLSEEEAVLATEIANLSHLEYVSYDLNNNNSNDNDLDNNNIMFSTNNGHISKSLDCQNSLNGFITGSPLNGAKSTNSNSSLNEAKTASIIVKLNEPGLELVEPITGLIKVSE